MKYQVFEAHNLNILMGKINDWLRDKEIEIVHSECTMLYPKVGYEKFVQILFYMEFV